MAAKKSWKDKSNERYSDFVENTNNQLLELMKNNQAPWQREWERGQGAGAMPYNATTGNSYSGVNAMSLMAAQMAHGYDDNRWLTFKQAQDLGCHVRKGERGTKAVKWLEVKNKNDEKAGQGEGKGDNEEERRRMIPVTFTVFNAEQIEGMPPPPELKLRTDQEIHEECERLIADSGADIQHGGDRAFYRPATDEIRLPEKGQFHSDSAYYATALHELGHWTGHESRLDRDLTGGFRSESYAREELRAEIASFMVSQRLGIGHDPSRHASYLNSWIKIVEEDPKAILKACSDAEKICEYLGVEKYVHEATQKVEKEAQVESVQEEEKVAAMGIPSSTPAQDEQETKLTSNQRGYDMGMSM